MKDGGSAHPDVSMPSKENTTTCMRSREVKEVKTSAEQFQDKRSRTVIKFCFLKVTRENLSCATSSLTTEHLAREFKPRAFQINRFSQFIENNFATKESNSTR